jgi:hypothetical protein
MRIRRRYRPYCLRDRRNRSPLQFHAEYAPRHLSPHAAVEQWGSAWNVRRAMRAARCRRAGSPPGIRCGRALPDRNGAAAKARRRRHRRLGYGLGRWSSCQRMPVAA